MFLSGTLLNAATVLVGGLLGTFLGDRLPERIREATVRGIGLFTLAMGAKFAIDTDNLLYPLFAILIGGGLGAWLALHARLDRLGDALQRRFAAADATAKPSTVSEAFVTGAIVFCVGPLTFLGAIQNGLTGDATLLTIKSVLDGFTAVALAATLGWGVLLTVVVILVYQGGLAAGASVLAGLLSDPQLREMNAVGGLLILGVGLKLLRVRDVAVADFLPAIVVAPVLVLIGERLRGVFS
jgi:uncharacterized membrane protein YqgA involved in biofilm formation